MADLQKLELRLRRTQEENEYAKAHAMELEGQLNIIATEAEQLRKDMAGKDQLIDLLNGKVEQLTERISADTSALKKDLAAALQENDAIKAQIQQYSQDVAKAHEDTVKYYTAALEQQQAEVEKLRSGASQDGALTSSVTSREQQQIGDLRQEIAALQEQLEQAHKQQRLQQDLIENSAPSEPDALKKANEIVTQLQEHTSALEQFSQELQKQNDQLREMITSQHAEHSALCEDLRAQIKELDARNSTLDLEIERLEREAAGAKQTDTSSSAEVSRLAQVSQDLEARLKDAEEVARRVTDDMANVRAESAIIESQFEALKVAHSDLLASEARREIEEASTSSPTADSTKLAELEQLKEHAKALEQFSKEMQSQNEQLREMITAQHAEGASVVAELQEQLRVSEEKRQQVTVGNGLSDAPEGGDEDRILLLSEQLGRLEHQRSQLEQENAKLRRQLEEDRQRHESDLAVQTTAGVSTEEINALTTKLQEKATERDALLGEVGTLKEHAAALQKFSEELQTQNAQLRDMITSQHEESAAIIEARLKERDSMTIQVSEMTEKLAGMEAAVADKDAEIQVLREQCEGNAGENAQGVALADAERQELTRRIDELEAEVRRMKEDGESIETANKDVVKKLASEHEAAIRSLTSMLETARQENEMLIKSASGANSEVEEKIHQLTTQQTHGEKEKEALRATIATLEGEIGTSRKVAEAVLSQLLPTVELPAGVGGDNRNQIDPLGTVKAAVQFIVKQRDQLTELKQSLQQWSTTYDQARHVNDQLNGQFKQVWDQHAATKEELAVAQMAITNLEAEALKLKNHEGQLQNDLKAAQMHISELETTLSSEKGTSSGQSDLVASLKAESEQYRILISEKDDEVAEMRREHDSLVKVLEQFQSSKSRDVEEATQYLIFEIDQLKTEIRSLHTQREELQDRADAAARDLKKELGVKNVAIAALQHKLNDLRRALEESISKLNDDQSIDKRVVSHLLVNYIHSVISHRGDEEDIVKVMSGLLNWDSDMMQRAGMIPGPQNPHTKYAAQHDGSHSTSTVIVASTKAKGFLGGVVKTLWGDPASRVAAATGNKSEVNAAGAISASMATSANASMSPPPKTIAEMWVDFLLTKSGEDATKDTQAASGAMIGGGDLPVNQPIHTPQSVAAMFAQQNSNVPPMSADYVPYALPAQNAPLNGYTTMGVGAAMAAPNVGPMDGQAAGNYGAYYIPPQHMQPIPSQCEHATGAHNVGMPVGTSPYNGGAQFAREGSY